jgi:hypothetical protein
MAKATKKFDNMDEPLPKPDPVHDRPTHPLDPDKIEKGNILCIRNYVQVLDVTAGAESMTVKDLIDGGEFTIDGRDMIVGLASADYFADTVRISKSQMVEILTTSFGVPFTVAFVKKDGQQRVLRGYLIRHEEKFGRCLCLDLELEQDDNLRLVDHRTLESLVVGGVRYLLS